MSDWTETRNKLTQGIKTAAVGTWNVIPANVKLAAGLVLLGVLIGVIATVTLR